MTHVTQSQAARPAAEVVDALAAKFGVAATHLWAVLTRQAYVEAGEAVVLTLVVAAVWYGAFRLQRRYAAMEADRRADWLDDWVFLLIVGGFALAVVTIVAVVALVNGLGYAVNPEFYAAKTVLDALK
jgi:hypothetical protein